MSYLIEITKHLTIVIVYLLLIYYNYDMLLFVRDISILFEGPSFLPLAFFSLEYLVQPLNDLFCSETAQTELKRSEAALVYIYIYL